MGYTRVSKETRVTLKFEEERIFRLINTIRGFRNSGLPSYRTFDPYKRIVKFVHKGNIVVSRVLTIDTKRVLFLKFGELTPTIVTSFSTSK